VFETAGEPGLPERTGRRKHNKFSVS